MKTGGVSRLVKPLFMRIAIIVSFVMGFVASIHPQIVHAATITANVFSDPAPGLCATTGTGTCSLREAVIFANTQSDTFIYLLSGVYSLTIGPVFGNPDGTQGALKLNTNITMIGAGVNSTAIDASGMQPDFTNALTVMNGSVVYISDVTVRGAKKYSYNGSGGGIVNKGALTVINSMVTDNRLIGTGAFSAGAGIYNSREGILTIVNSVISNNISDIGVGGGIYEEGGSVSIYSSVVSGNSQGVYNGSSAGSILAIQDSTIRNNAQTGISSLSGTFTMYSSTVNANMGGGIENSSNMTIVNSTISGNSGYFGGIANNSTNNATIINSTIAENQTGLSNASAVITLRGTLLANFGSNCLSSSGELPASLDFNLSSDSSCAMKFTNPHDLNSVNPQIAPLADNGGMTQTHALLPPSIAIDHGGTGANGCPATDQRGIARPQGAMCDIGAYEVGLSPAPMQHPTAMPVGIVPMPQPVKHAPVGTPIPAPRPHTESGTVAAFPVPITPTPMQQPIRH